MTTPVIFLILLIFILYSLFLAALQGPSQSGDPKGRPEITNQDSSQRLGSKEQKP